MLSITSLTGEVLNIVLDPLFIYVFDLDVAGAAIATAISQVVSNCVYLTYIFRKKSVFHFRVKDCTYTKEAMSEIFKIGIPTLVFQILTSVSISLINNAAGDYALWILYGVFFPIPCFGKRQRGLYPRSLQAGDLLYPRYPASPDCLGAKWNYVCPADCRCAFRNHNGIHGDTASQKAE